MKNYLYILFLFVFSLHAADFENKLKYYKKALDNSPIETKYDIAFEFFNKDELYRLFIDKKRLENPESNERDQPPHLIFDVKEPGYFAAMLNAFNKLHEYIGQKIDLNMIVELHDLAVNGVTGENTLINMQKGLSLKSYYYHLNKNTDLSSESINELFKSNILFNIKKFLNTAPLDIIINNENFFADDVYTKENINNNFLSNINNRMEGLRIESIPKTREKLEILLNPIIEHYYESIEKTKTINGKLSAISELLRALEVAHFLPDGNQRTYAFLLLTKLLIENSLPPAILEDPAMFDGYMTVKEMSQAIITGIGNFLTYTSNIPFEENVEVFDAEDDYEPYFIKNQVSYSLENFKNILSQKLENQNEDPIDCLKLAILFNRSDLISKILEQDQDNKFTSQAFHFAIEHGKINELIYILEKADKNYTTNHKLSLINIYNQNIYNLAVQKYGKEKASQLFNQLKIKMIELSQDFEMFIDKIIKF